MNSNIKKFEFPTFEEWQKRNNSVEKTLGAYRVEIRAFSWGENTTTYQFAMALANCNALNVYTERLFSRNFRYDGDDEKLRQWYNGTVEQFHIFWENHIKSTYFETK